MNEFDNWRKSYETMTLEEQVEYHNDLESRYPNQAHYTFPIVNELLTIAKNDKILEFGCWKGDMAQQALSIFKDIKQWKGIEICKAAIKKINCNNPKFSYIFPSKFNWFEDKRTEEADIIFATHFIEHLSNQHFEQLVKYCSGVNWVYFECPITEDGQTWEGDISTHKLEYGWKDVVRLMEDEGYRVYRKYSQGIIFQLWKD